MQTIDNDVQWFVKCFARFSLPSIDLEKVRQSIDNFYRNPLTRTSTFLGGFQGNVTLNDGDDTMINRIAGKTGAGLGDETMKNDAGRVMTVIPIAVILSLFTGWTKF